MRTPIKLFAVLAIVAASSAGLSSHAAAQRGPCAQIAAACREAGFVPGAARAGNGLQVDCVQPIMQGSARLQPQPQPGTRALPTIDPKLVAACKAANPNCGQRNAAREAAGEQAAPANLPRPPPDHPQQVIGAPTLCSCSPTISSGIWCNSCRTSPDAEGRRHVQPVFCDGSAVLPLALLDLHRAVST